MFKKLLNLFGLTTLNEMESAAHPLNRQFDAEDINASGRSAAYNRLRLVLMHDRTQLEPHVIEALRDELVIVISKYIDIDKQDIELNLETDPETNQVALMASIPVKNKRDSEALKDPNPPEIAPPVSTV
jgi:cell division topological specificity factor